MAQKQKFNRWLVAAIVVVGNLLNAYAYAILSDAYDMDPSVAAVDGRAQE